MNVLPVSMHSYRHSIIVLMTHYILIVELRYSSMDVLSIDLYPVSIIDVYHRCLSPMLNNNFKYR
jgi:hypothetical protein